jgi:uncharacterized protein YozE (UPF0346 family)
MRPLAPSTRPTDQHTGAFSMAKIKTFYKWMIKRKKNEKGFIGDLARDMIDDHSWPSEEDVIRMHDHLLSFHACIEAHQALDEAWSIFTKQKNLHWFFLEDDDEIEITTTIVVRPSITPTVRFNVFKRDNYRCKMCGRDVSDGVKLEVDHIIARANGGSNEDDNLWTLCFECNRGKRTRDV